APRARPLAKATASAKATARAKTQAGASAGKDAQGSRSGQETVSVPLFGKVAIYRPRSLSDARGVILFVSGDGGWNKGVVDMARRIADRALVVGLSMPAWQKTAEKTPARCWYPAGDLETAAQAVEKIYGFPRYMRPILVGYSSGATVVYGALAQGPPDAFAGAVSLGFCPDLEVARPFCGRDEWKPSYDTKTRRTDLPPSAAIRPRADGYPRWVSLEGEVDQVCAHDPTAQFIAKVPGG